MTLLRVIVAAFAAVGTVVVAGASPVHAQANCEWYARTALRQQQINEERKCGFKGEAWHSDLKAHLNWCASVSPDAWKDQAKTRDQQLAQCARK